MSRKTPKTSRLCQWLEAIGEVCRSIAHTMLFAS